MNLGRLEACRENRISHVKQLLREDKKSKIPLMLAINRVNINIARVLLKKSPDVDRVDKSGFTYKDIAKSEVQIETFLLLNIGYKKSSIVDLCLDKDYEKLKKAITKANVNEQDIFGRTCLMVATYQ